jgi:hypothetical protein
VLRHSSSRNHSLENCQIYQEHKKEKDAKAAPVCPMLRHGEHLRADIKSNEEDRYIDISILFGDSLSIASKTKSKKTES